MPGSRYFFHITDGQQKLVDRRGIELPSALSARERAIQHARHVVNGLGAVVDVTDDDGASVLMVPLVIADSVPADRDPLTGLAGRGEFLDHLTGILAGRSEPLCLLLLDVDLLDETNDAFGYAAGDTVLRHVAAVLRASALEAHYASARLSGDKFAVLLPVEDIQHAIELSTELQQALGAPLQHDGTRISHTLSAGLALSPEHADDAIELVRNADIALQQAKGAGSGRLVVYSSGFRVQHERHIKALAEARSALIEQRIVPYYQPKISLLSGGVDGFEALLRVDSPTAGIQPPAVIADALDHPTLSVDIGRRMQERAFDDIASWRAAGIDTGTIAINASPVELLISCYADGLLDRLQARSIPPELLQVEVTETAMIGQGASKIMGELQQLRSAGVGVFLDDFGTGYGSLVHLIEFAISGIKIDRSFIGAAKDDGARSIAALIIDLGQRLHLEVVAEGVETEEQAAFLLAEGCEVMQGYLFARAMPAGRVGGFLSDWKRRAPGIAGRKQKKAVHDVDL